MSPRPYLPEGVKHSAYRKRPRWKKSSGPEQLQALLAFTNTVDFGAGTGELASPQALSRWLAKRRLLSQDVELDDGALEQAKQVCAGLRSLFATNNGAALSRDSVRHLDTAAARSSVRFRFEDDGSPFLEATNRDVDGALASPLTDFIRACFEGTWRRLKICEDEECRRAFYDDSRNRTGRWCSKRCGDRNAARHHRRRRKS